MTQLTGLGLYTFPEAARLAGVPTARLRHGLQGYDSSEGDATQRHPPLWSSELSDSGLDGLSFLDLLEACFVKEFRCLGISLQAIHIAAINAREILRSPYPFACKRFRTDGKSIFADAMHQSSEYDMLDLGKRQYVMKKVVEPSLLAEIEFGADQQAARRYPMKGSRSVVVDPNLAFGKPIVNGSGLCTDVLYDAWLAEAKDKRRVARLYEVPMAAVETAIRFEQRLAA